MGENSGGQFEIENNWKSDKYTSGLGVGVFRKVSIAKSIKSKLRTGNSVQKTIMAKLKQQLKVWKPTNILISQKLL